jgi:F-type H+-transporting ATPase subunit b
MLNQINQFAAEESATGLSALGVDGKAFIIQLITFGLAFLILRRYAFGPILDALQKRRELIDSGVELGEKMKKQQSELDAKIEKTMHETREKADQIISEANSTSRQKIREAEDKAREKASQIHKDAEARIASDTERAKKKLEKEMVGLISDATEAIIHEKVDAKKDAALIDRALKESKV